MSQPLIFISYHQKDEAEKEELLTHLGVLKTAAGLVDLWSDDRIGAGAEWREEINQAIKQARVAILLVSANFLSSDFIVDKQIPKLLQQRHNKQLIVIPVVAKACAWQKVEWLARMAVRPRGRTPVWANGGIHAQEHLAEITNEVAEIIKTVNSPAKTVVYFPRRIPFTNQQDPMASILATRAPAYHLLDAPAGYGKTELLLELERNFKEQGWVCSYISADRYETLPELVAGLAQELDLGNFTGEDTADILGFEFGGRLKQKRRDDITQKGLTLLLDLGRMPSANLIDELLAQFIPKLHNSLKTYEFFRKNHSPFRVVLAGRYLAGQPAVRQSSLRPNVLQLRPFSYEDVLDGTANHLPDCTEDVIQQLAAHIMYVSGGHPGCIAALLEMYKDKGSPPPDDFFDIFKKDIRAVIEREVKRIRDSIPAELQAVMDVLGIFRYLNYDVLKYLIDTKAITGYADQYVLGDTLTNAYLLGLKSHFLYNDNTHRLLALRLWRPKKSVTLALDICKKHLADPETQEAEMWAVEYLYQFLQCTPVDIEDPTARATLRAEFIDKEVPKALKRFTKHKQAKANLNALMQILNQDQKFQFTVNYYLRANQYNNEPFEQLIAKISSLFAGAIRAGGE